MDLKVTTSDIGAQLSKKEIARVTADQITKDFGMHGVELCFSTEEDMYLELHSKISITIQHLMYRDPAKLTSILYQVDIAEKDLIRARENMHEEAYINFMTQQIIFRDLKKVLLRLYYRSAG